MAYSTFPYFKFALLILVSGEINSEICPVDCTCLFEHATMTCKDINLQLPDTISPLIRVVTFKNCNLGDIWPKMPDNYSRVEALTISGSQFKGIEDGAFQNLDKLHTLKLIDNCLETINKTVLEGLVELKEINLEYNQIALIENDTFEHNPKLQVIILNNNPGIQLSRRAFAKTEGVKNAINRIELQNCGLNRVPTAPISNQVVPALTYLDLSKNDLHSLPDNLFKHAPGLKFLYFDGCKIPSIQQETFADLDHLQRLILSNNAITRIADHAFDRFLDTLKFLYLDNNHLTKVSSALFNFDQLKVLNVSYNPWECSCENEWLQRYPEKAENTNNIRCALPATYENMNAVMVMTTLMDKCVSTQSAHPYLSNSKLDSSKPPILHSTSNPTEIIPTTDLSSSSDIGITTAVDDDTLTSGLHPTTVLYVALSIVAFLTLIIMVAIVVHNKHKKKVYNVHVQSDFKYTQNDTDCYDGDGVSIATPSRKASVFTVDIDHRMQPYSQHMKWDCNPMYQPPDIMHTYPRMTSGDMFYSTKELNCNTGMRDSETGIPIALNVAHIQKLAQSRASSYLDSDYGSWKTNSRC